MLKTVLNKSLQVDGIVELVMDYYYNYENEKRNMMSSLSFCFTRKPTRAIDILKHCNWWNTFTRGSSIGFKDN